MRLEEMRHDGTVQTMPSLDASHTVARKDVSCMVQDAFMEGIVVPFAIHPKICIPDSILSVWSSHIFRQEGEGP